MRVIWGKGRRSRHNFMGFAKVTYKEDPRYNIPRSKWKYIDSQGIVDNYKHYRATRREQSLKTILRRVKKMNYPEGTRLIFFNWYVGYADIMIIV